MEVLECGKHKANWINGVKQGWTRKRNPESRPKEQMITNMFWVSWFLHFQLQSCLTLKVYPWQSTPLPPHPPSPRPLPPLDDGARGLPAGWADGWDNCPRAPSKAQGMKSSPSTLPPLPQPQHPE